MVSDASPRCGSHPSLPRVCPSHLPLPPHRAPRPPPRTFHFCHFTDLLWRTRHLLLNSPDLSGPTPNPRTLPYARHVPAPPSIPNKHKTATAHDGTLTCARATRARLSALATGRRRATRFARSFTLALCTATRSFFSRSRCEPRKDRSRCTSESNRAVRAPAGGLLMWRELAVCAAPYLCPGP